MTTEPTDFEILEGSARAIGLKPRFIDAGDEGGYYVVPVRDGPMITSWNPLKQASQSQQLQATLKMDVLFQSDGTVFAGAWASTFHEVKVPALGTPDATLRRAIALVAYLFRPAGESPWEPS